MATLLLTRPEEASRRFAKDAAHFGMQIEVSPVLTIAPSGEPFPDGAFDAMIVTSAHGARMAKGLPKRRCYVVGAKTASYLNENGHEVVLQATDARDLLARLPDEFGGSLLIVRGRHSAFDMASELVRRGQDCAEWIAYDQTACGLTDKAKTLLQKAETVFLPVFSPRSAYLLSAELAKLDCKARLILVAMSRAVAEAFGDAKAAQTWVADQPDSSAMISTLSKALEQARLLEGPKSVP